MEAEASEAAFTLTLGKAHWLTALATNIRGSILGAIGRNEEAEALLLDSYQQLTADENAAPVFVGQALQRVMVFYQASGNQDAFSRYQAIYQRDFDEG